MSYSHTQHTWVFDRSHAYLLCHYSNSSNPSGTPSGNCFTRLAHSPDIPGYSSSCLSSLSLFLIQATPRESQAAIASHVLLTYPAHLRSHAYLLSNSSNPSGAPSGNCFTCLTHIPSTPGYSSVLMPVIILIQATPREPRAAISSHVLLTYPVLFLMLIFSVVIVIQATPREPRAAIASHVLLTYPAHLGIRTFSCLSSLSIF